LGKGMRGKFTTQRKTEIVAGGFPVTVGCYRAIELKQACCRGETRDFNSAL
jgi:hypothetical protein